MPQTKLIAISALAKEARQVLRDDYLAGLWKRHLAWELTWSASGEGSHSRPSDYRAPTWSWASVDGEICYTAYADDRFHLVDVLKTKVKPAGRDDTGAIRAGYVCLRRYLYPVSRVYRAGHLADGFRMSLSSRAGGGKLKTAVPIHLGVDEPAFLTNCAPEDHYLLRHHASKIAPSGKDFEAYHLVALLLKYDSVAKTYSRQGMVQLFDILGKDVELDPTSHFAGLQGAWRYGDPMRREAFSQVTSYTITLI